MQRKSVSYLMELKADVADCQREIHELSIDLEITLANVANITTEEARGESFLNDHIKLAKQLNHEMRGKFKYLENAVERLRSTFGYSSN